MRRGCISLGHVVCDICSKTIPYPERYLAIDEKDGVEVENGATVHYCIDCAYSCSNFMCNGKSCFSHTRNGNSFIS